MPLYHDATNLAAPVLAPNATALVVRDMAAGTLTRVDAIETGAAFDPGYIYPPAISADGTAVASSHPRRTRSAQARAANTSSWRRPSSSALRVVRQAGGAGSIEEQERRPAGAPVDPDCADGRRRFGAGPRTIQL
jgi:hypothetical protein